MRIGTIVTATNNNPLYIEFIPMFVKAWKKVLPEADVHILLIAESIPVEYNDYKDYIKLVKPIAGVHTAFHAQCIRLLYPREVKRTSEAVLITDMDMIPLNNSYYTKPIESIDDNAFIVYRDVLLPVEIPMCYVAGLPNTWTNIFGSEDTETLLKQWYQYSNYSGVHAGSGWNTDQLILTRMFKMWDGNKVILNDTITNFKRLCRQLSVINKSNLSTIVENIKSGMYCDYHCLRPYSRHKEINDLIIDSL
jgi:hypothetical protein